MQTPLGISSRICSRCLRIRANWAPFHVRVHSRFNSDQSVAQSPEDDGARLPATWPEDVASRTRSHLDVSLPTQKPKKAKTGEYTIATNLERDASLDKPSLDDFESTRRKGYPTVIQQARNNMQKFGHCVVLTRVGNFYELYFAQAEELAPLLGLKIGAKPTTMGPVPIAGFPFFQLDRYLKLLVQDHGKYVAISEETANDAVQKVRSGGLMFDRQVTRVITPGTLIDENFLNPFEHNYILAISVPPEAHNLLQVTGEKGNVSHQKEVGLAWLDLSSGDFFTQSADSDSLASAITRVGPREIVLANDSRQNDNTAYTDTFKSAEYVITYHAQSEGFDWAGELALLSEGQRRVSIKNDFSPGEEQSAKLLVDYVKTQLPGTKLRLQAPIRRQSGDYMTIDRQSLTGLEIIRTMRDGYVKGSMLHAVNRSVTNSGSRLLAQRLCSPSMSPSVINERLDLVESLINDGTLLEKVTSLLKQTSDTLRLLQKFSFGRGTADDLVGLSRTIEVTKQIATLIMHRNATNGAFEKLSSRFEWEGPDEVAKQIAEAIDEEKLRLQHQSDDSETTEMADQVRTVLASEGTEEDTKALKKRGFTGLLQGRSSGISAEDEKQQEGDIWIMRRTASSTLESLHQRLEMLSTEKIALETNLQDTLSAKSLTLRATPGLGHICHVKGKDTRLDFTTLDAKTVSSSKSTRSFYLPAWTTLGSRIDEARSRIRAEEIAIFTSLRTSVITALIPLRRNAAVLDDLDVSCSAARLAIERALVRPILNHSSETKIFAGRHVMVDAGLASDGRSFTPNDCHLHPAERLWLITGPNMAGKSTFLRQTALISIMAQTGMYVPAAYAEIGLVDAIYSRVGAADNLAQEQSTFMVEMLETAAILRGATPRSFVIMDEVGRGTTPEDGIAVGYAVLDHLRRVNGCRALFATHFHELTDMTEGWEGVARWCTDVKEEADGAFRYDHRLRRGVNRESHALKVAQLAGLPGEALQVAREILGRLKKTRESKDQ